MLVFHLFLMSISSNNERIDKRKCLSDDQQQQLDQLIEKLEDDDDVTEVYTSAEVS